MDAKESTVIIVYHAEKLDYRAVVFNLGPFCPLGDIWPWLDIILAVQTGEG